MKKNDVNTTAFSASAGASASAPFSLVVTLKFTDIKHKEELLRIISPLAAYIHEHEPTTLAYEVLLSDKDPLQVMLLERYKDKEHAFLKIHRSSEEFQKFRPKLKAMQDAGFVEIDGHSYVDSMVGFGDRAVI